MKIAIRIFLIVAFSLASSVLLEIGNLPWWRSILGLSCVFLMYSGIGRVISLLEGDGLGKPAEGEKTC